MDMVTTINRIDGWESYPRCLLDSFYDVDRIGQSRLLDSEAGRLFSGHDDAEVWTYERSTQGKVWYSIIQSLILTYLNNDKC